MSQLNRILDQVKAQGERITFQRWLVVEALCETTDHVTINELRQQIQAQHAEQDLPDTTIYRILQWLKNLRLVSQTDMGATGTVYQLLSQPHHHLICLTCGSVTDVDDAYLDDLRHKLSDAYGFKARIDHMAIYGQCRVCAANMP